MAEQSRLAANSLFAASRQAAQEIMEHRSEITLRYETSNDARIRDCLKQSGQHEDDEIDIMLRHYHRIARLRMSLGMKEGEGS